MGMSKRQNTVIVPRDRPTVEPPTRGQVEVAARYFGKAFDWSEERTKSLFDFAIRSVATARAMVEYAILLARSQVSEAKLEIPVYARQRLVEAEAPLNNLMADLKKARKFDNEAGGERLLEGIPFGRKLNFSVPERHVVVDELKVGFAPPSDTPVEEELYRTIVGQGGMSLRLADFIIRLFMDEAETAQYVADLKAARATESGSPAPEADATEEDEVEEPAAPAAAEVASA